MSVNEQNKQIISDLVDSLIPFIENPSIPKLPAIIVKVVQKVELVCKEQKVEGLQKRQIAINVLTKLIERSSIDEGVKETALFIIDEIVPSVIDALISADKNGLFKRKPKICCL